MKSLFLVSTLALVASTQAFGAETAKAKESLEKSSNSTEILWKLSEPDTMHTAIGLSYGSQLRGFVYLDLQNVPATSERKEKLFHVPGYALGFTIRDRAFGGDTANSDSAKLRTYSDVFVRYSEASKLLGRDGYWTLGIQPGLNLGGAEGVSVNLGFEYSVNLIDSKTAEQQSQLKASGVVSHTVRPAITFNFPL